MKDKIINIVIGLIFLGLACWLFLNALFYDQDLLSKVFELCFAFVLGYFGLYTLFHKFIVANKILSYIFNRILSFPVILFFYFFEYIVGTLLTFLMFVLFYFLPSIIILELGNTNSLIERYHQGIIYLLSLISVLLFAYKSSSIMRFIIKIHKTKFLRSALEKYSNSTFTRIAAYVLMIAIYITYNFLTFSGMKIGIIPSEMLNVIKEVFVTFVAVDTLIQINSNNNQTVNNKEM